MSTRQGRGAKRSTGPRSSPPTSLRPLRASAPTPANSNPAPCGIYFHRVCLQHTSQQLLTTSGPSSGAPQPVGCLLSPFTLLGGRNSQGWKHKMGKGWGLRKVGFM
ncbi:hypothetical protein VUR80DRAFT_257 [Thermomyces stellatus]